jgi:clavulanate-9-aldehyde reducatase
MTRAVLPHLRRAGRGDVVSIGSVSARGDRSGMSSVYAATKAAVAVWGDALDAEVGGDGIRVVTISPGTVRTSFADGTPDPLLRARRAERFSRIGLEPRDVANQVVHVMSQPPHVLISELVIRPMAPQ